MPPYKKEKMSISIDSNLLKKVKQVAKYPKWRGNKSAVVEAALEQFLDGQK